MQNGGSGKYIISTQIPQFANPISVFSITRSSQVYQRNYAPMNLQETIP
jgi:hypothetical protein